MTLAPEPLSYPDLGVSYVYADLRDLPYRDGYFDTIVSLSTLEHVGHGQHEVRSRSARPEATRVRLCDRRSPSSSGCLHRTARMLVSVPYGAREDHGWFRQFDADDVRELIAATTSTPSSVAVFAYSSKGWERSSLESAAEARYRDHRETPELADDLAAAARAVACIRLDYGSL